MRIATWNINSVRIRLDQLERLVQAHAPDVICLQEIKVQDHLFPSLEIAAMGYPHQAIKGQKSYNGVAILSKTPLAEIRAESFCGYDDCRHISALVEGVEVHSLYIPAGGDIPDPALNEKFAHKLAFMKEITSWSKKRFTGHRKAVLAGDFNVAPLETDVWDHKKLLKVVTHTPVEVDHLEALRSSANWLDVARVFIPPEEPLFTWWSYRATDWRTFNRGRRLDHIWTTPSLSSEVKSFAIAPETRDWERPSDHIPVIVELG